MDQKKKRQPQDLWWICGPRIDSEPCSAMTFVSKPWVAWSPHPLILCFHSVLPALVHVAKIPLLTHDVLNSHDLWMYLSPLQGDSYIFLSPETSTAPGTWEGFTKGMKPQKTPLVCWLQTLLRGLWAPNCQLQIGTHHGHLPSTSIRIKSHAAATADFQHPLKGVQCRDQKWGTLCSGRNWQNRSSGS